MTFRINANSCKNAMGTVFLLAAAFFVCSTFISMRSVFADPIAPENTLPQKSGRASPRSNANTSRANVSRSTVARPSVQTASRTTASRGTAGRKVSSRSITPTRTTNASTRNVVSRNKTTANRSTNNRAVRARTSTNKSRVSATGSVMSAGSRAGTTTTYSYLNSKLYTGSYANIIDSTTGLISADAYSNCLDSYYTCMDEICTARSNTKGRCSCAGRVNNYLEAETALEAANEELIKLSGQLSLLISSKGKGKDLAYAFSLTEAEQVMNCVSWQETKNKYGSDSQLEEWCKSHNMYDADGKTVNTCKGSAPSYCTTNSYGFNISDLNDVGGSSSDILAQLKAWADAKDLAKQYETTTSNGDLESAYMTVSDIVAEMTGSEESDVSLDALANKWGYKLFEYAHNNVCGRVLDSCFNGIYEACGTPPTVTDSDDVKHNKCANGATSSCPFNYNSYISVVTSGDNQGDVKLNERGSSSTTSSTSASCFGYTTTSTSTTVGSRSVSSSSSDPYYTLRGPVADARRSIMQKYLLDANAACDTYGEALKQTAQNINYQKIAAEQALQAKRLEFKQEEESQRLADVTTAIENFTSCIDEIWECYEEYEDEKWTTARIKAYCSQVSQVPHCYETMICAPLGSQFTAIVDLPDSTNCTFSTDYSENTCRNVVTISEILYGTGLTPTDGEKENDILKALEGKTSIESVRSAAIREACLQKTLVGTGEETCNQANNECLRGWTKSSANTTESN